MKTPLVWNRFLLMATAAGALAAAPLVRADRHVDVDIGFRVPHGYAEVVVGREHYYHYHGMYYRRGPHGRLVVVRAPRGAVIRELPPRCVRFRVGPVVYFRFGDVCYREVPGGFMVVDAPVGPGVPPPPPPPAHEFLSVWAGPNELLFKDGQFYQRTPEGLVWTEVPVGALSRTPPPEAVSVWVHDTEYLLSDNVYFRKTPDGYRVVEPPAPPPPMPPR